MIRSRRCQRMGPDVTASAVYTNSVDSSCQAMMQRIAASMLYQSISSARDWFWKWMSDDRDSTTSTADPRCRAKENGVGQSGRGRLPASNNEYTSQRRYKQPRGRILLAEDNDINQVCYAEALVDAGYQCDVVATGRQAMQSAHTGMYDLLLLDMFLPEMNGCDVCRVLRTMEATGPRLAQFGGQLVIVGLAPRNMPEAREQCVAAGMDGVVAKPADGAEMVRAVNQWLYGEELVISSADSDADSSPSSTSA